MNAKHDATWNFQKAKDLIREDAGQNILSMVNFTCRNGG
jgi:hypothetical protein